MDADWDELGEKWRWVAAGEAPLGTVTAVS